jgi:hypothetical protein
MRYWLFGLLCLFSLGASEFDALYIIEENFIQLGKKDAYEKYAKELRKEFVKQYGFSYHAYQEVDSEEYIYLTPLKGFSEAGTFLSQSEQFMRSLPPQTFLPYASTLHFTIKTLHGYLETCSYVPAKKGKTTTYPYANFHFVNIEPAYANDLEAHLNALAQQQRNSQATFCFKTWKEILGTELPRYAIGVFGSSEKDIDQFSFMTSKFKEVITKHTMQKTKMQKNLSFQ